MLKSIIAISVVIALFFTKQIYADDSLILDIAKREKVSVDVVKKAIDEGCSSGVTSLMNECANYRYTGADIQLNRAYQALLKKFNNSDSKILLVNMQKAWIVLRDATCNYESASWGQGSGYYAVETSCQTSKTKKRTEELNEYLKCENGCPWD